MENQHMHLGIKKDVVTMTRPSNNIWIIAIMLDALKYK
jgi:hypothetical protein